MYEEKRSEPFSVGRLSPGIHPRLCGTGRMIEARRSLAVCISISFALPSFPISSACFLSSDAISMPHVELLLSTSGFFIFLSAVVAVSLSIFAYRHTVPVLPQAKRYLLVGLRSLALFFLILLFLEPILRLVRKETKPPAVAILVDDSKSMNLTDRGGNRAEIARALLKSNG